MSASFDVGMSGESAPAGASSPEVILPELTPPPTTSVRTEEPNRIDLLLDITLDVSVELGRTRMTIGEILALHTGSVIELDKLAGEPADILVNGTLIARGEVVVVDEKFGVRIIEVVSRASRLASLG